jgi:hypothetical protein
VKRDAPCRVFEAPSLTIYRKRRKNGNTTKLPLFSSSFLF